MRSLDLGLLLLLSAVPASSQDRAARTRPVADEAAATRPPVPAAVAALASLEPARRDRVFYDEREDSVWARGADYKAGFDADGVRFVPLLGSDATRSYPVHFAPPEVAAGGQSLDLEPHVPPRRTGDRVLFDRGPLTEVYELAPGGMEQLFVFAAPSADGELVLTLPVESELQGTSDGGGLRFDGARGGVRYGSATVLDAAGRAAPAPTEWTGAAIVIRVPASFLANATWPVTVDPLVSTFLIDDYHASLTSPDVAYDVTTDTYLVVYNEYISAPDSDVYFRQLDATGTTIVDEGYIDASPDRWVQAAVANNNGADRFLIVATEHNGSYSRIVSRTLDAGTGALGPVQAVAPAEFADQGSPDVGGDFYDGSSFWCVTWFEVEGTLRNVFYRLVDATGLPIGTPVALSHTTDPAYHPRISDSAGDAPYDTSVWTIVWESGDFGARWIFGAQVRWDGALHLPLFQVSNGGPASTAAVSSILDGSGDRAYMVVYEEEVPGSIDIMATVLRGDLWLDRVNLTQIETAPWGLEHQWPGVDSDGERFVVTYLEQAAAGSPELDLYLSTYSLVGDNLCPSESRVLAMGGPEGNDFVDVSTQRSGGGARQRAMAVWQRYASGLGPNIHGALYDAEPTDCLGRPFCTYTSTNSSGERALLRGSGVPIAGGHPLTLNATRLPFNQFGYFLASMQPNYSGFMPPNSQGSLCLGGSIARFNRPGEVGSSGPSGSFSLNVDTLDVPLTPASAVLPGETWFFQGWFRDQNPSVTSNFTNGIRIVFD